MSKFSASKLHSGGSSGAKVTSPKQAVAIMYSEKRAAHGKPEYASSGSRAKRLQHAVRGLSK